MIKTGTHTRNKLAILLALSFSWLFIHALILFHQEHVFGQNVHIASWSFIKPVSKDKTYKLNLNESNEDSTSHKTLLDIFKRDHLQSQVVCEFRSTASFSPPFKSLAFLTENISRGPPQL